MRRERVLPLEGGGDLLRTGAPLHRPPSLLHLGGSQGSGSHRREEETDTRPPPGVRPVPWQDASLQEHEQPDGASGPGAEGRERRLFHVSGGENSGIHSFGIELWIVFNNLIVRFRTMKECITL